MSEFQTAAHSIGEEITVLNASTIRDIDQAFCKTGPNACRCALGHSRSVLIRPRPTVYSRREFAIAGGLMSYGSNINESYRLLGVYAARILKGEKPGDLPIQLPNKYELVINVSTARVLGVEVPPSLLASADEVIE